MKTRVWTWAGAVLLGAALWQPVAAQECAGTPPAVATPDPGRLPERLARVQAELGQRSYGVVALGDSIMQGWPPDLLDGAFGAPVLNAGFGRDRPEHVLWRLDSFDWSRQKPREVLILVGTNGIARQACEIYGSVRTVIEKAQHIFPGARVVAVGILPRGENLEGHNDNIVAVDRMLRQGASAGHYAFLDAHDDFLCDHRPNCDVYAAHNVHLTRAGYELLTGKLRQLLAADHG